MKRFQLLLAVFLTGIIVALLYHFFEALVRESTHYVWGIIFDTYAYRWVVFPLCIILTVAYFGVVHFLDPKSENTEEHGFGAVPKPSLVNIGKVLLIGFLSLLAGASLGPEAILVPACMLAGAYIGKLFFPRLPAFVKLMGAAGFIALFAAFFHSFIIGVLSVLLVAKQAKIKLAPHLVVLASVASASCVMTLFLFSSSHTYFHFPPIDWSINMSSLAMMGLIFFAGILVTFVMAFAHTWFGVLHGKFIADEPWWMRGALAGFGLSIIYLFGGSLIEFTGNESIKPFIAQSASLGVLGVLWIIATKIMAISWSKTMGYRGGMIFPSVFVASGLVILATMAVSDLNFIYGLIVAMAGIMVGNSKTRVLA